MATLPPKPFPQDGLRKLTPKELLQRAKALNCTVPESSHPTCTAQLNLGIFFDGTGNNIGNDYFSLPAPSRKHSNIVRLFNVFPDHRKNGYFRIYVPGVGTPFPAIGDEGAAFGGPFAWNGENRITWALIQLLNQPSLFINKELIIDDRLAGLIANNLASILSPARARQITLQFWQDKLRASLVGKKPEIELINLNVFGFSRGSAEARAFSNWLFEICEYSAGGWKLAGIPIRLGFLGIFDTVASVGIPNSLPNMIMEGHQSWADGNMKINPAIEQCVHYVAGHEVRASFPLDSVRFRDTYPGNAREVMYPGSHSDLGGGYAPNDLGISPSIDDMYAKIPASEMYKEARVAGVPLKPWTKLVPSEKLEFSPSSSAISSFNAYVKNCQIGPSPIEESHRKHMMLYLSYRYKYRNNSSALPFYVRASKKHKKYIDRTTETITNLLGRLFSKKRPKDMDYCIHEALTEHEKIGPLARDMLGMARVIEVASKIDTSKLTPEIEHFFGNYVHDSMAGFIEMGGFATDEFLLNDQGIFRYRKIFKENG